MAILSDFQDLPNNDFTTIAPICRRLDDFIQIEIKQHGTNNNIWNNCRKNKECLKLDDMAEDYYERCDDI